MGKNPILFTTRFTLPFPSVISYSPFMVKT